MGNWFFPAGIRSRGLWISLGWGLVATVGLLLPAGAQSPGGLFSLHHRKPAGEGQKKDQPTVSSSQPPAFSVPVEPLGFFAPGAIYQGQRESLVSLDFLDEDRLLFTFHAPGLMHREEARDDDERQVRAIVVALPQGAVVSEALWTLHDRARYLWML